MDGRGLLDNPRQGAAGQTWIDISPSDFCADLFLSFILNYKIDCLIINKYPLLFYLHFVKYMLKKKKSISLFSKEKNTFIRTTLLNLFVKYISKKITQFCFLYCNLFDENITKSGACCISF